jgi:RNA polymerase sigma factor (sigma-70 family)
VQARSDAELVGLARSGDKDAFGELVARYRAMVQRAAWRMVADGDLAQDLAQEALLQAFLSLDHLRDDARFPAWLYGIALNICRSYLRESKIAYFTQAALSGGLVFEALEFSGTELDPEQAAEERELHRIVLNAVNELSPENRRATLLFYYEELGVHEVAAVLGISVAAVKGRLHKARKHLRATLAQEMPMREKEKQMRKVTIADVVKREQAGAEPGQTRAHYIVVLLDEVGQRALPIWIGPFEGRSIALGLRGSEMPRPLTFNFIAGLLQAAGARLEEVRIESLKDDVFYAVAKLKVSDRTQEIDARPSDALALAVRTGSPIYAAEEVLERCAFHVPTESIPAPQLGRGMENIVREFEEGWKSERAQVPQRTKEELERSQQELVAAVFGG